MPRWLTITLISFVALVGIATAWILAWDAGRKDLIANGVRVGSVDVSGMRRDEAHATLQARLLKPLTTPLVVRSADMTFALSAREARTGLNIDALVDEAVKRSRAGGVLARAWRGITGERLDARLTPRVEYSRKAVQRIVDRVRVAVSRKPVDAKVSFSASDLSVSPSRRGRTIDTRKLRAEMERALVSTTAPRTIVARIQRVEPKVTEDSIADKYPVVVTVDRGGFRLRLFKHLELVKTYPIAVGQAGHDTPTGVYRIQNKAVNPAWNVPNADWAGSLAGQVIPGGAPNNPLKARWLGVYDGVGVHGTADRGSIGSNASHGCIRMLVEDVVQLYDQVPVGTPIYIA